MTKTTQSEPKRPGYDPERARHIRETFRRLTRPRKPGKVYNPCMSPARTSPKRY